MAKGGSAKHRAHVAKTLGKGRMASNGNTPSGIPDDIEWDAENPPTIYACSQHIEHLHGCDGTCESQVLVESAVELTNEARAWARAGMAFKGVPECLIGVMPLAGPKVEIFDVECRQHVLEDMVLELVGETREEFDERFRQFKVKLMREIREMNETIVRRSRAADALGIVQKPGLLGPNGEPLM